MSDPPRPTRPIFLSYATEDRPRTRLLVEALEAQGWSVWWDRTIPPGRSFDEVIEEALDNAGCVVVLWSQASVGSDWVKTEAAEAQRRRILVPALLEEVKIPFEFRRIQAASLIGWTGDTANPEFQVLLQAISAIMRGTPVERVREAPSVADRRPPRRGRGGPIALAAAVVLIALGVAGSLWMRAQRPVIVGVMEIQPRGNVPSWMCDFTRDALNTVLSKIDGVQVAAKQKIDLLQRKRALTEIEAAEQLGIAKMISGTISVAEHNVVLQIDIVDIKTGMLLDTEQVRGTEQQLVDLQNKAAVEVLKALKVRFKEETVQEIVASRTNDQLDSYKLLTESMGGLDDGEAAPPPAPKPKSPGASWTFPWPPSAQADEGEEAAVKKLLERYRVALQAKNLAEVSALYLDASASMRDSLKRYFETSDELNVRFSNFDILIEGNEGVATFTRNDDFKDLHSGRDMHLEVRVASAVTKQGSEWKIRGMRKPS